MNPNDHTTDDGGYDCVDALMRYEAHELDDHGSELQGQLWEASKGIKFVLLSFRVGILLIACIRRIEGRVNLFGICNRRV